MAAVALAVSFGIGLAANAAAQNSGFLKDYSQLTVQTDRFGVARRMWVSPKFTGANYQKLLLEPIAYYPQPQPTSQVPQSSLDDIRGYMATALSGALGPVVPLVKAPGPGVARVELAITATGVQGAPFQPYDLIPAAFLLRTVSQATGVSSDQVQLAIESRITDSVSGEVLGLLVREAKGVQVPSNQNLTLPIVKSRIDEWAAAAADSVGERLKAGRK